MTTPPTLDPAVEEVLVDLAKAKERTLFTCDPATLARNLGGANAVISANATGLLPVERHLLATMRNEVLELLLCAAREALFEAEASKIVATRPRVPHARWLRSVALVLHDHTQSPDSGVAALRAWQGTSEFTPTMLVRAVGAARELSDSPRVRIYLAWEQMHRRAWGAALVSVEQLFCGALSPDERRATLEVAYISLDGLGQYDRALRACTGVLTLADTLESARPTRALVLSNQLLFALLAMDRTAARAAARQLSELNDAECRMVARTCATIARRGRHHATTDARFDRRLAESLASEFDGAVKEVCLALT
ncbi:MAG: hypothetical protein IT453_16010 [Planctomycetes bacterium]|nr:hypothetical protein [Planctomycetota bacterium]